MAATDTILEAINKLDGNVGGKQATISFGTGALSALGNTVNGASGIVVLDGSSKLPAVDGSALTNMGSFTSYTVNTTDNTPTVLATVALSDVSSYTCKAYVSGFRTDSQDTAHFEIVGSAYRSGGACVLEDSTIQYQKRSDVSFSVVWGCSTNSATLSVKGNTGKTIHWKGLVLCEQAY